MHSAAKNLVIGVVGDNSQHHTWLDGRSSGAYDVALVYYGNTPDTLAGQAEYFLARRGCKFPLIAEFIESHREAVSQYDYIWLPDDDIATSPKDLQRLFEIARQYRLMLAQPAIRSGDVTFRALQQAAEFRLRYSPYVEVMCPLMSQAALQATLPTFHQTASGWGIDWAWTRLVDRRRIAVIDAVGVDHTRPIGSGDAYRRFEAMGVRPADELRRMLREYRLNHWPHRLHRRQMKYGTARTRAIDRHGNLTTAGPPWWKTLARTA